MNRAELDLFLNSLNANKGACRALASACQEGSSLGMFASRIAVLLEKAEETIDILSKSCYCSIDERKEVNDMSVAREKPLPLWGEVNDMPSDKEKRDLLIDEYTRLQRIKAAPDRDKEIEYQLAVMKAKLEGYGAITEDLDIH